MTHESFLALSWLEQLPSELQKSQKVSVHTAHDMGKQQSVLDHKVTGKTYTDHTGEENIVSQPVREGNLHQTPKYRGKNICTSHNLVGKTYTQSLSVKMALHRKNHG